ncbi:MAG: hypothetical protein AB1714_24800 [Acidobacteriota bacterium]
METVFRTSRWPILCLVIGIALGLCGVVLADDNEKGAPQEQTGQPAAVPSESQPGSLNGAVAAIDDETGELRAPTAEEMKQLDEQWEKFLRSAFPNRPSQKPFIGRDGRSMGVLCGPESLEFSVATIGPDGKLRIDHVTGAEQAKEIMTNTVTSKQDDER